MLLITKTVGALLTPPALLLLLALLGLLLLSRWRRLGLTLTTASLLALLVVSLPITASFLLSTLESSIEPLVLTPEALRKQAGAIVILGGGRASDTPEYAGDTVSSATLERLRYGARLHNVTGVSILVTGGSAFDEAVPEAALMRDVLMRDFHVDVRWTEERSRTTHENALYSRAILETAGIRRVVLVTHAWHMRRAVLAFRQAGIDAIPAATIFNPRRSAITVLGLLPSGASLAASNLALREWLGILWYRLLYGAPVDPATGSAASSAGDQPAAT